MWQQLIDKKAEWIGGTLTDFGDSMDRQMFGGDPHKTEITDFELTDKWFGVKGKEFDCGGSREFVGITGEKRDGIDLLFSGYGAHEWGITKPISTHND